MRKLSKTLLVICPLLFIGAGCSEEQPVKNCLEVKGEVILDPKCFGVLVQVKDSVITNQIVEVEEVMYENVIQVLGMDSSLVDSSLFASAMQVGNTICFDFREFDLPAENPRFCTTEVIPYSLKKKVIVTSISIH